MGKRFRLCRQGRALVEDFEVGPVGEDAVAGGIGFFLDAAEIGQAAKGALRVEKAGLLPSRPRARLRERPWGWARHSRAEAGGGGSGMKARTVSPPTLVTESCPVRPRRMGASLTRARNKARLSFDYGLKFKIVRWAISTGENNGMGPPGATRWRPQHREEPRRRGAARSKWGA